MATVAGTRISRTVATGTVHVYTGKPVNIINFLKKINARAD